MRWVDRPPKRVARRKAGGVCRVAKNTGGGGKGNLEEFLCGCRYWKGWDFQIMKFDMSEFTNSKWALKKWALKKIRLKKGLVSKTKSKVTSKIENQEKTPMYTTTHRPRPDVQTSEWAMASFAARLEVHVVHVLFFFHMVLIVTCGSRHVWNIVFVWCFVVSCADVKHHLFPHHFHLAFLKYHCFREIFFFNAIQHAKTSKTWRYLVRHLLQVVKSFVPASAFAICAYRRHKGFGEWWSMSMFFSFP